MFIVDGLQAAATMGSTWSTVGIAIERYLIICHNYTSHRMSWYIVPIALGSLIFNIPIFFLWEINVSRYTPREWALDKANFMGYFILAHPAFVFFLPVTLLLIFNAKVVLKIRKLQRDLNNISETERYIFTGTYRYIMYK